MGRDDRFSSPAPEAIRPNPAIYGHFSRLVTIKLLGQPVQVPEGTTLIRALQYLQFEAGLIKADWSRFCFNDTSGCCEMNLGRPDAPPSTERACRARVQEQLQILSLPPDTRLVPPEER